MNKFEPLIAFLLLVTLLLTAVGALLLLIINRNNRQRKNTLAVIVSDILAECYGKYPECYGGRVVRFIYPVLGKVPGKRKICWVRIDVSRLLRTATVCYAFEANCAERNFADKLVTALNNNSIYATLRCDGNQPTDGELGLPPLVTVCHGSRGPIDAEDPDDVTDQTEKYGG
ncbi:MAG: hypothetical protein NT077_00470 [Candidatus Taylorbacteria bacterium]|nr:hypothetical protein [Candidatus Taylorbacteria bacterium]